jgi:hypothetical protein
MFDYLFLKSFVVSLMALASEEVMRVWQTT